jgi:hypothetical protein
MAPRRLCRRSLTDSDFRPTDALLGTLAPRLSAATQMLPASVAEDDILEWVGRCRPALRAWVVIEDALVPGSVPPDALRQSVVVLQRDEQVR